MGCDGGTIPTRDELVRLKKKPEQKDKNSLLVAKWKHCAITQEPLRRPIVACELGKLYSKESVLELLLDKTKFEGATEFDHIRGLKDIKALELTQNPAYQQQKALGDGYVDKLVAEYICPITGLEMSGRHRFCFIRTCGCVFSERALKELKTSTCNKCGKAYTADDVIVMNGTDEDVELLRAKMEFRRHQAKLEKKSKKKSSKSAASSSSASTSGASGESSDDGPSSSKKPKLEEMNGKKSGKLANGTTDASSSKVVNGKASDKSKPKSIQHDPSASSVYKGLFTTSEACKKQPKGHWVTYNPQYN